MGRQLRRVPLDFEWPHHKPWKGFLNPHYTAVNCRACAGSGSTPTAKLYCDQWYGNAPFDPQSTGSTPFLPDHPLIVASVTRKINFDAATKRFYTEQFFGRCSEEEAIRAECRRMCGLYNGAWSHHLSQDDVAALIEGNRLWDFTRVPRTPEQAETVKKKRADGGNSWLPESNGYVPTAKEVNEWSLCGFGHDSINAWCCVEARCKRNGEPHQCAGCQGHGHLWPSEAAKKLYYEWEQVEPPAGEGWQMWETVSEGSPISPVFKTAEELAVFLALQYRDDGSYDQWLAMIQEGRCPSLVMTDGKVMSGVEAVSAK